jgi:predicted dehydrogenase
MQPVNWGILSTSSFATERFLPGLRKSPMVRLAAVGSRNLKRAQAFAKTNNIAKAYGSYEEVLEDPEVEIVYVPVPNHLHVEWTVKAAKAGKHVLCEKPMGMTAKEVEKLRPLARKVHIAEAFMVRFHPQWIETRERVRSGEIGRITHMHVAFAYNNLDPKNIRNIEKTGGGALYDIGCYAIVAGRWFYETEPLRGPIAIRNSKPTACSRRCSTSAREGRSPSRCPPRAWCISGPIFSAPRAASRSPYRSTSRRTILPFI